MGLDLLPPQVLRFETLTVCMFFTKKLNVDILLINASFRPIFHL